MNPTPAVTLVTEALCDAFEAAAPSLLRRRTDRIPPRVLADLQALGWIEGHLGSPRIAPLGHMALVRIRARAAEAVA
jgi:hypothetical protein